MVIYPIKSKVQYKGVSICFRKRSHSHHPQNHSYWFKLRGDREVNDPFSIIFPRGVFNI